MGVKDLWSVLAPVGRHMPLKHLSGQTLAVDLSIWVCETQSVKRMQGVVTKPHLRNLFFRISHLSQLGVKLVFAIEGAAPDLKLETMSKRQNSKFSARSTRGSKAGSRAKKPARSHFNSVLRECCEVLDCLGIPYVQSTGEAEAMCAVLNAQGLVDGCLTNDGDAFLYGARVVYRNFTMNTKDPHVEVFRMDDLERELRLNREKLVAMAILLGCDYMPQGVPGVGRELVGKLMQALDGVEVLKRMVGWRLDPTLDALEAHAGRKKVPHCVFCHHPGSQRHHDKWGCTYCGSDRSCTRNVCISCPCEWHEKQHQVELRAVEFSIRQKTMKLPSFPPKNVIQEFMETKDKVAALRLTWKRPKLFHFQRLCSLKLEWEEEYSLAKFLPLLTLHDMTALLEHGHFPSIQPHAVIKSRVRHGVSCYEVEWNKLAGDTTTETEFYVTVESQDLFARCFPLTVQQFAQDTATKRNGTSKGKSKKAAEAAKQMTDDDTVIADVTSGLGRLQLYTEGVERGDACTGFTGASAAGSWMQGTDGDKEEFDDSCILLDTPGDVVNGLGDSPTHARLDRVSMCDSYLSISPVTDASDTSEMNSSKDVMPSRKAEEHSDNDDDVFLSLSERLQRQKVTRLEGETGRKPLTTSHIQDVTDTSVARSASSNSAAVEPVSNKLTNRENYSAGANELSVMTNRLPSTTRQLYSSLRQPGVGRDVSFNSSQLVKLQTEDNKASGQSTCSLQEVSADRHHVQNGVCFDLQLQDEEDSQPEGLVEHLNKKSDSTVVDSVESKVSGIHSNAPVHQLSQADDGDSYSCTDDELGNSPDLEKCNKQQLHSSPQSHDDTQTKMCSEKVECSQPNSHYSISRSVERIRSCWARDVVMSPDLFDSSCDDDNSFCTSTLTPSVGMMQNQRDTDRSLCGISQWDIETPMHSARPGKHDNGAGRTDGGRVHSDVGQECYSFKNSSFSCYSFDIDCSSTVKLARSAHISSIKTTALDDSAFGSCDSSAAYTDSVSTHTPQRSQSLGDSVCEDIGDFKLHSSLLCELDYLCDSTDLDDSVFICSVEPSASDTGSNRTHGTPSRCRPNLPTKPLCQQHCHKTNDTPPQIVQGRSDIVLDNVPTKCNIQATCVKSTANGDISPQQVSSPVCLADRLKLRLAKTNKAYLVSCLSRDTSTTSSSFNDC